MIELLNKFGDQSESSLHMLQSHKSLLKSRTDDHSKQFRKTTLQIRCFAHLKKGDFNATYRQDCQSEQWDDFLLPSR